LLNIDYTQHYKTIRGGYLEHILGILFLLIVLIWFCVYCCKIYLALSVNDSNTSIVRKYFSKEHLIYIFVFIILAISTISLVVYLGKGEFAKDLHYVINNNYSSVTGKVIEQGAKPEYGLRTIYVENSVGKLTKCKVGGATYELGNVYEIIYLPNTRIGCIVRQIE